jgi:hypothetical protein
MENKKVRIDQHWYMHALTHQVVAGSLFEIDFVKDKG